MSLVRGSEGVDPRRWVEYARLRALNDLVDLSDNCRQAVVRYGDAFASPTTFSQRAREIVDDATHAVTHAVALESSKGRSWAFIGAAVGLTPTAAEMRYRSAVHRLLHGEPLVTDALAGRLHEFLHRNSGERGIDMRRNRNGISLVAIPLLTNDLVTFKELMAEVPDDMMRFISRIRLDVPRFRRAEAAIDRLRRSMAEAGAPGADANTVLPPEMTPLSLARLEFSVRARVVSDAARRIVRDSMDDHDSPGVLRSAVKTHIEAEQLFVAGIVVDRMSGASWPSLLQSSAVPARRQFELRLAVSQFEERVYQAYLAHFDADFSTPPVICDLVHPSVEADLLEQWYRDQYDFDRAAEPEPSPLATASSNAAWELSEHILAIINPRGHSRGLTD